MVAKETADAGTTTEEAAEAVSGVTGAATEAVTEEHAAKEGANPSEAAGVLREAVLHHQSVHQEEVILQEVKDVAAPEKEGHAEAKLNLF